MKFHRFVSESSENHKRFSSTTKQMINKFDKLLSYTLFEKENYTKIASLFDDILDQVYDDAIEEMEARIETPQYRSNRR